MLAVLALCAAPAARAENILFDASHHEMGGNADWVIDADQWNLTLQAYPCTGTSNEANPQALPTPAQAGVTAATPETFWTGAISSWGIDLVKAGHHVETLPNGGLITFGDGTNPQDLSNYKLFIVVEPQTPFSASEKTAILAFVNAGGGLFMVADHETSDRDCDTWDSPHVFNDLTGATSAASAGLFGIWFRVDGIENQGSEDWFDEAVNNNVSTDPSDPIIHGPFGSGTGGLGLFGSTSMDLNSANNATVAAHVWRNAQTHNLSRVTFATALYGSGRVAAIGDSSPADDGTGDPSDSLHGGWDKATGGVDNREIHLNACVWLLNPVPDTTPPAFTGGPSTTPQDCSAVVTWTTDEPASSSVSYGPTASYGSSVQTPGFSQQHSVTLGPLVPSSTYHYRAESADAFGNGPTFALDDSFITLLPVSPVINDVMEPIAAATQATIQWTTNEPSTSQVEYGTTPSYGFLESVPGLFTQHSVTLAGLTPDTTYHFRVASTDGCGNGPTYSADDTFTTGPASIDVSGWSLRQYNSSITWTIPPGTTVPAGGYLVVGRNATRAEFNGFYPALPAATIYLNSNENGSCTSAGCFPQVNGGESYELYNPSMVLTDGMTVVMSSTHQAYQRNNPGDPAGSAGSWTIASESAANPGSGAGSPSASGLRINEMSDAPDFTKEFIELYYDAGAAPPDGVPPAPVSSLTATPLSDTSIRLNWTAVGDDGTTGTATSYDIRRSASGPISTEAAFAAATPLTGEPAPLVSGSAQQMTIGGLTATTSYYFAMKVSDEAANVSGLSNTDWATTAPSGGTPPVNHLVVSQIQTNGDGGTPADDEFVELYNPTNASLSTSGLSVQYKAATGTTHSPFALPAHTIQSHGWYLVARSVYNGSPAADATNGAFQMAAAGGNVFLVNGTTALPNASCSTSASIIDKVAWGTGNCPEVTAPSAPAANNSVVRKPGGTSGSGQDSDNNSADFQSSTPSAPHNRFSTPATPPSSLGSVGMTLFLTNPVSGTLLDWANAAGATAYRVYRGSAGNFMGSSPSPWQTPTASQIVDASFPAPGAAWFYIVRATDGTNESSN